MRLNASQHFIMKIGRRLDAVMRHLARDQPSSLVLKQLPMLRLNSVFRALSSFKCFPTRETKNSCDAWVSGRSKRSPRASPSSSDYRAPPRVFALYHRQGSEFCYDESASRVLEGHCSLSGRAPNFPKWRACRNGTLQAASGTWADLNEGEAPDRDPSTFFPAPGRGEFFDFVRRIDQVRRPQRLASKLVNREKDRVPSLIMSVN